MARTLFDELLALGFGLSYQSLTRHIREANLRPHCERCAPTKDRAVAVIEHPPGEETQWDWVELPDPPEHWGWGKTAFLLVGALAHSGKWRGILCPSMVQPQLIDGLDRATRKLGGVSKVWRFDRMATVCHPGSGKITATFAAVAKHYGVSVAICPARRGNRKGVVEKSNHTAAQRVWRNMPDDATVEQAQERFDTFAVTRGDTRLRPTADGRYTVAVTAAAEPLRTAPAEPFPAVLTLERVASAQALVAYRGNFYSVSPELARARVLVSRRLGSGHLDIATTAGVVIARHRAASDGHGLMIRDHGHVIALEKAAMAASDTSRPHRRKERIPPGVTARAAASVLRGEKSETDCTPTPSTDPAVIDLSAYERAAHGRNTLS